MYWLKAGNGLLKSMYERLEIAIAKAEVQSLDCTAVWFFTQIHRGFRHKNVPLTILSVGRESFCF